MNILGKPLLAGLFVLGSLLAKAQQNEAVCYNPNLVNDTTKKSIKSMAVAGINGDSITISYHSPGVRKRVIWGGLVPYDEVWVTGAHNATTLSIGKPFIMDGQEIPAGKYAIFTIPGRKEWTVILNRNWEQHLASEYDQRDDVARIKVKPGNGKHLERLQYFIDTLKYPDCSITMHWERKIIVIPFTMKY